MVFVFLASPPVFTAVFELNGVNRSSGFVRLLYQHEIHEREFRMTCKIIITLFRHHQLLRSSFHIRQQNKKYFSSASSSSSFLQLLQTRTATATTGGRRMSNQKDYEWDLIVIGGGSGGLAVSKEAASLGAKVALFDFVTPSPRGSSWGLGGTCVNVGCIPKKMMHVAALVGENIRHAHSYGWKEVKETSDVHWSELVQNVQDRIKGTNWTYKVSLRDSRVTYFNALAEFADTHTVRAKDKKGNVTKYTADKIVISVGGRPKYPENVPGALEYGITSDDLFSMTSHPGKTLVVGASYIALETAGILAGLNVDVTVLVRRSILRGFDRQMADLIATHMQEESGVKFLHDRDLESIELIPSKDSKQLLRVTTKARVTGVTPVELSQWDDYNTVMFATGRYPLTEELNLSSAGVQLDGDKKIIATNDDLTTTPNIYAIGDCVKGRPELTPAAIQAGLLLARRLFGKSTLLTDYENCPTTIFTPMEYGCVGLSEEAAVETHGESEIEVYHTYFQPFESQLPATNLNRGYAKIVCLKSGNNKVLGLHFLGPNAGEVVQGFAVGIRLGMTKSDLDATIGIHPTSAENFSIIMSITKSSGLDAKKKGCCG